MTGITLQQSLLYELLTNHPIGNGKNGKKKKQKLTNHLIGNGENGSWLELDHIFKKNDKFNG